MINRVVITGIGPVSSIGIGKKSFWQAVRDHKTNVQPIPDEFKKHYNFKSKYFVPLPVFNFSELKLSSVYDRIMRNEDRMAVLGAKLAFEDANFSVTASRKNLLIGDCPECSIIIGIGLSGLDTAFNSYTAHLAGKTIPDDNSKPDFKYNRFVIPMTMPNSVSTWISILFDLKGVNHTINSACASGTFAIGEAFRRIKAGYDSLVVTGGVECLHDQFGGIMRGFDVLGTLTKSEDGLPIPFSKQRSGFLFAEGGGCILILEEYQRAVDRGAKIYAEILDYQANSDAHNIVQIEESGKQIFELLRRLSSDRKIDYLNTHGTGTVNNDKIEAQILQEIFGGKSNQPFINSTKGILGHTLGASGAFEVAVTALSIKNSIVNGNNIPEPMEGLNIVHQTMSKKIEYAISTSYGFGGHNGGLLLKKI